MTTAAAEKKLPIVNGKLAVLLVSLISGTIGAGSAITVQWKMFPPAPTIPDNIMSLATDPYARPGAFTEADGDRLETRIKSRLHKHEERGWHEEAGTLIALQKMEAEHTNRALNSLQEEIKKMTIELQVLSRRVGILTTPRYESGGGQFQYFQPDEDP